MPHRCRVPFAVAGPLICLLLSVRPATAQLFSTNAVPTSKPSLVSNSFVSIAAGSGTGYAVGGLLTGRPGSWSGATSLRYLWQRCSGTTVTYCTTIPGQTALTYLLTAADAGSIVRFMVTATNSIGSTTASANSALIVAGLQKPVAGRAFTLTEGNGAPSPAATYFVVGSTVGASQPWAPDPVVNSRTQAWQRCTLYGTVSCVPIPGQTTRYYLMTAADVGFGVRLEETATNAAGATVAVSNTSPVIKAGLMPKPALVGAGPNITTPAASRYLVGSSLGVSNGTWAEPVPTFAYSWQRCPATSDACVAVAGQSGSNYPLTLADVGSRLRAAVTASNSAGTTVATSNISDVIRAAAGYPPAFGGGTTLLRLTVVSGAGDRIGDVIAGPNGPWLNSPTSVTINWLRCTRPAIDYCQPIPLATTVQRTIDAGDANNVLVLREIASNASGSVTVYSGFSPTILSGGTGSVATGKPLWSGKGMGIEAPSGYRVGARLDASSGTWSGAPTSITSVWQSCDAAGMACVAIAGQTERRFAPIVEYVGRTIRYQETATNAAGSTTLTSLPTPVIQP